MQRLMFKSKIHRATVTAANRDYEGSLTVDADLLDAADILPYEQIHVWDVTNGARAHLVKPGDLVIVATYTLMTGRRARKYQPTVVFVDAANKMREADGAEV